MQNGDADNTGVWVDGAAGMVRDVLRASGIVRRIAQEAEKLLGTTARGFVPVGTSHNLR